MPRLLSKKQKLVLILAVLEATRPKKVDRRLWVKKWLLQRRKFTHALLLKELEADDFRNYLRMDENSFVELLNVAKPFLTKQNTPMREAISSEERLLATLRFLATGRSYEDMKFSAIISPQLLCKIIPETCSVIYRCLRKYIKMPSSAAEWKACAANFEEKWDFSHCVGAMDGKHIAIRKPPGSGSLYYNYKKNFSIILFAVVNAEYELMYVHVGTNGCVSDSNVLEKTSFHRKLLAGELNLPESSLLPNSDKHAPYVFVGDCAFALNEHIMKPYPLKGITKERRVLNYRLSRSRRVSENCFGILASRFRVLLQALGVSLESVEIIVLACLALHNFLLKKSKGYVTSSSLDREDLTNATILPGDWRHTQTLAPLGQAAGQQNATGSEVREPFMNYFNNEGQVHFQEDMIFNGNQ